MSVLTRLINDARRYPAPKALFIEPQEVDTLADELRGNLNRATAALEMRRMIASGKTKIMGLPLRVNYAALAREGAQRKFFEEPIKDYVLPGLGL